MYAWLCLVLLALPLSGHAGGEVQGADLCSDLSTVCIQPRLAVFTHCRVDEDYGIGRCTPLVYASVYADSPRRLPGRVDINLHVWCEIDRGGWTDDCGVSSQHGHCTWNARLAAYCRPDPLRGDLEDAWTLGCVTIRVSAQMYVWATSHADNEVTTYPLSRAVERVEWLGQSQYEETFCMT